MLPFLITNEENNTQWQDVKLQYAKTKRVHLFCMFLLLAGMSCDFTKHQKLFKTVQTSQSV